MTHNFLSSDPKDLTRTLKEEARQLKEREAQKRSSELGIPYVNLQTFPVDLQVLGLFSEAEAAQLHALPFFREHKDLRIGTSDPTNALLKERINGLSKSYNISLYYISEESFNQGLKYYGKVIKKKIPTSEDIRIDPNISGQKMISDLATEQTGQTKTASELLGDILGAALSYKASDIHIEPEEHLVKVRFRIDGVLHDMVSLTPIWQKSLTARLKLVAKLKLNVTNATQDGRFTFFVGDKAVDVRVSILPSSYGESFVLRLLGIGATKLKLAELGMRKDLYAAVEHQLHRPNGMMVTTGPTGSGKTTTLYAFLNELNESGVKIITLEDPVEYKLEGIQQTPVDYRVDFNFAKALRAILRQDPDIVMVGEIRDPETAETALQAALTGHVVLSTLHTNDAAGAIPRLLSMGVKPFIMAPALNGVIAQRLVRKLCEFCKKPTQLSPDLMKQVEDILNDIPKNAVVKAPSKLQFFQSPGCEKCNNLGYEGRVGIYELIEVNDKIKELILKEASGLDIKKQAYGDGMVTMAQDGLLKALEGVTDVEEVFRVAGE